MNIKLEESTIVVERGIVSHLSDYFYSANKIMIISDTQVPKIYKTTVMSQFSNVYLYEIESGESSKNILNYQDILTELLNLKFSRKDTIIALGGGVVCDLAGFVAATYKRGCEFVSIPTTTLAQIDASVGGKVGINFNNLKNSVGAFCFPKFVFIDIDTLITLPKRHFYNGLVEALKAGMLGDEKLYRLFLNNDFNSNLQEIIERSILYKAMIVEKDPCERGVRKLLNYGHTIGHAIESVHEMNDYYHGECVAAGILWMSKNKSFENEVKMILDLMGIPKINLFEKDIYIRYIENDKKTEGNKITVSIVDEIGKGYLKQIDIEDLF